MMVGRTKGPFGHKIPLELMSFTFVDAKEPNFDPNFVKTINKTLQSKMSDS